MIVLKLYIVNQNVNMEYIELQEIPEKFELSKTYALFVVLLISKKIINVVVIYFDVSDENGIDDIRIDASGKFTNVFRSILPASKL